ncbi:hypothetical protein, partial [Mobiluncus curtisii]|uniref:hypothetical protein n=1 Tax=Mobiluncus curtisii TaxID=2051 RepID=UPI0021E2D3DB
AEKPAADMPADMATEYPSTINVVIAPTILGVSSEGSDTGCQPITEEHSLPSRRTDFGLPEIAP